MTDFFRFPHTPHLAWLSEGNPRDDKLLTPPEAETMLAGHVVVEEKLDGANLGISICRDGVLRFQNRGQYLTKPWSGQFSRLSSWLASHEDSLTKVLAPNLILFGEWCTARHSLDYSSLPDWFLAFDIFDRIEERFWSTTRRNEMMEQHGISHVPSVFDGETNIQNLENLVLHKKSRFRPGPMEGVVVRQESEDWLEARAKLVRPDFTQAITEHWSRRGIDWNRLTPGL